MMPKNASCIGSSLSFRKEPICLSFSRQMKADAGCHAGGMQAQSKQSAARATRSKTPESQASHNVLDVEK